MAVPAVVNINDVREGHVALEVSCIDRLYLNAYVPHLQVGGQVVRFLTEHLGNPIPSPALFEKIATGSGVTSRPTPSATASRSWP